MRLAPACATGSATYYHHLHENGMDEIKFIRSPSVSLNLSSSHPKKARFSPAQTVTVLCPSHQLLDYEYSSETLNDVRDPRTGHLFSFPLSTGLVGLCLSAAGVGLPTTTSIYSACFFVHHPQKSCCCYHG